MSSILESMMAKPRVFRPETVAEYTALQLAKKLDDADNVLRYITLLDRYDLQIIGEAFTNARARNQGDASAAFVEVLRVLAGKETKNDL